VDRVARGYGLVRGSSGTERRKPGTAGEPVYSEQWIKGPLPLFSEKDIGLAHGRRGVARLSHPDHPRITLLGNWSSRLEVPSPKIETLKVSAPEQSIPKMMRLNIQGAAEGQPLPLP
jgi:hypothetical protein